MIENSSSMDNVLALILGGGAGTRLYPLTALRAKPAVPLGGKYRLVDIPISNCLNSSIRKIYVLTQFNSVSLHRHIFQTYKFDRFSGGFVQILAAEQTPQSTDWYTGTADAVRKQTLEIHEIRARDVLILSGDHLYRMDYRLFIKSHRIKQADVTISVKPVSKQDAPRFGILKMDRNGRITKFSEKPSSDTELDDLVSMPGSEKPFMASMGIYAFTESYLQEILRSEKGMDFGKHIIPAAIQQARTFAYPFDGYWEDIGTMESFFNANLALADLNSPFDFYDPVNPVYSRARYLPGSRIDYCQMVRVLLADGCRLSRAIVTESVIGLRSIIKPGVQLRRVVMMGADYYESEEDLVENRLSQRPDIGIGENSVIEHAIIDKNARIGKNVKIRPHTPSDDVQTDTFSISDGIVVIPKNSIIADGAII
ncbi:MAG: glucose-1-phosphate adenylyltransferase [Anaerolineales bacterium]|nr:glucose-1-phosphate adenylyltransferase [Anaerolineales bacterium]